MSHPGLKEQFFAGKFLWKVSLDRIDKAHCGEFWPSVAWGGEWNTEDSRELSGVDHGTE